MTATRRWGLAAGFFLLLLAALFLFRFGSFGWGQREEGAGADARNSASAENPQGKDGGVDAPAPASRDEKPAGNVARAPGRQAVATASRVSRFAKLRDLFRDVGPDAARDGEFIILFRSGVTVGPGNKLPGFTVLDTITPLRAALARREGDLEALLASLDNLDDSIEDVDLNWTSHVWTPIDNGVPLPNTGLATLRVVTGAETKVNAGWGAGITIALLDSGAADSAAVGSWRGVVDVGYGTAATEHGTAVAKLSAGLLGRYGFNFQYWGVAPAAGLLSIPVGDLDGISDVYTMAKGMAAAVDGDAEVLALGPASIEPAVILDRAVDYATGRGLAVVAAGAGSAPGWPAADPRVIAVGSITALPGPGADRESSWVTGGPALALPYEPVGAVSLANEVRITLPNGNTISDSAAHAAVVAGAIAAVMSSLPGTQAPAAWQLLTGHFVDSSTFGGGAPAGFRVLNLGWIAAPQTPYQNVADVQALMDANPGIDADSAAAMLAQPSSTLAVDISSNMPTPTVSAATRTTPAPFDPLAPKTYTITRPPPPAVRGNQAPPASPRAGRPPASQRGN